MAEHVGFYVDMHVTGQQQVEQAMRKVTTEAGRTRNFNLNVSAALTGLYAVSAAISHIGNAIGALANNPLTSLVNTVTSTVTGVVNSTISSGLEGAGQRYDILRTFPMYMEAIGYSATDAQAAVEKLNESVLGLPTSLSDIVDSAKYFTLLTGDLEKGSDMAIALNNAFLASGTSAEAQATGMREVSYLLEGSTLTTRQWQSVIKSMPVALREMGTALGYVKFTDFTNALRHNQVSAEDFMNSLIEIGSPGGALSDLVEVQKNTVSGAMSNMRIAVQRAGANVLTALDQVFNYQTGEGLIRNLYVIRDIINTIGQGISTFIRSHQTEIMDFFNAITKFNWQQFLSGVLQGLTTLMNITGKMLGMLPADFLGQIAIWGPRLKNDFNAVANVIRSIASVGMYARLVERLSGGATAATRLASALGSIGGIATIAGIGLVSTAVYTLYQYLTQARREADLFSESLSDTILSHEVTMGNIRGDISRSLTWAGFRGGFSNLEGNTEITRESFQDNLATYISEIESYTKDLNYRKEEAQKALAEIRETFTETQTAIKYDISGYTPAQDSWMADFIYQYRKDDAALWNSLLNSMGISGRVKLYPDQFGETLLKAITPGGRYIPWLDPYANGELPADTTGTLIRRETPWQKTFMGQGGMGIGAITALDRDIAMQKYGEALAEIDALLGENQLAYRRASAANEALGYIENAETMVELMTFYETLDETSLSKLEQLNEAYANSIEPVTARIQELDEAMANVAQTSEEFITSITESAQKLLASNIVGGMGDAIDKIKQQYGRKIENEDGTETYEYNATDAQEAAEENLDFFTDYYDLYNKVVEKGGEEYGELLGTLFADPTAENMLIMQSLWDGEEGSIHKYAVTQELIQQTIANMATSMDEVVNQTHEKYEQIKEEREDLVEQLSNASDLYQAGIMAMLGYIRGIDQGGQAAINKMTEVIEQIKNLATTPVTATMPLYIELEPNVSNPSSVQNTVDEYIARARGSIRNAFGLASGGYVQYRRGGGSIFRPIGSDTVPAMLTPGEFVQNRTAVNAFGLEFMHRINNLDLAGALRSITRGSLAHAFGGFTVNNTRDNHANLTQNIYTNNAGYGFRRADRYVRAL